MKPLQLMLVFSLAIPVLASSQLKTDTSKKIIVQDVRLTETVDDPDGPPPNLKVKYKDVREWLTDICNHDKPNKFIAEFRIGLIESSNNYTIYLNGWNRYTQSANESSRRIEFEPHNGYCKLPKAYYENLNREQLLQKITGELKAFVKSDKFKKSFFIKGNELIFESNGQIIWSK